MKAEIEKRVIYPDGSSVETLLNGTLLIREGKPAPIEGLEVQPAPYNAPPPAPKWKEGFGPECRSYDVTN